ncbi:MAG: class I SAM-dependent methyltransferase [Actinobacteria bacterium]|nr:class I SAM-dependent methyltransferase [Actinomycetota bacterium]
MALDEQHRVHANSFGAVADIYERGRPSYPPEAIGWLVPAHATRVADLGAGTGKLTRQLRERGLDVIAVEPSAGMREQLHRGVPGVPVLGGTGEQIPLGDHSVDAVLVAQAWHWVDPERAVPEVARVLAPGGRLGLLWNRRVEDEDWAGELSTIVGSRDTPGSTQDFPDIGPPFGPVEQRSVEWLHRPSRAEMTDWVASRSYVITLPDAQRHRVLGQVRDLLDTHPALAGGGEIALHMVTLCFRADLPG